MHYFFNNVNDAFVGMVRKYDAYISEEIENGALYRTPSRVGDVVSDATPTTLTYEHPKQRVLFNQARDANPFFHLYEALWMLAGEQAVAPLSFYSSKIAEIASDDGKIFNGAYGNRWRYGELPPVKDDDTDQFFGHCIDQIQYLIDHLTEFPNSRRAVLSMWNVSDDLTKIDNQLGKYSKDVCCNLCVKFRLVPQDEDSSKSVLNMTVFNRSNDLILGCLGANYVHFTILQEYIASSLGVEVGRYNQVSDDFHVYVDSWKGEEWLEWESVYSREEYPPSIPLMQNKEMFDYELYLFVDQFWDNSLGKPTNIELSEKVKSLETLQFKEPFLRDVARPMSLAFFCHKAREYKEAFAWLNQIKSQDWYIVASDWIRKRRDNYVHKTGGKDRSNSV